MGIQLKRIGQSVPACIQARHHGKLVRWPELSREQQLLRIRYGVNHNRTSCHGQNYDDANAPTNRKFIEASFLEYRSILFFSSPFPGRTPQALEVKHHSNWTQLFWISKQKPFKTTKAGTNTTRLQHRKTERKYPEFRTTLKRNNVSS